VPREGPEVLQLRRPNEEVQRLQPGPKLMADWLALLACLASLCFNQERLGLRHDGRRGGGIA
jgi:hypothetical protein